jgi:hypothetical protein
MIEINRRSEINHPALNTPEAGYYIKKAAPGTGQPIYLNKHIAPPHSGDQLFLSISLVVKNPLFAKPL